MSQENANGGPPSLHPQRLQEGDRVGFDESGQRVAIAWPNQSETPAASLLHGLEDLGVEIGDVAAALAVIERELDRHGDTRAAEALRIIFERIGGGKRGAELKAALRGAMDEDSGQAAANKFKISRQTWHTNVARLRRKLLPGFPKNENV